MDLRGLDTELMLNGQATSGTPFKKWLSGLRMANSFTLAAAMKVVRISELGIVHYSQRAQLAMLALVPKQNLILR